VSVDQLTHVLSFSGVFPDNGAIVLEQVVQEEPVEFLCRGVGIVVEILCDLFAEVKSV